MNIVWYFKFGVAWNLSNFVSLYNTACVFPPLNLTFQIYLGGRMCNEPGNIALQDNLLTCDTVLPVSLIFYWKQNNRSV